MALLGSGVDAQRDRELLDRLTGYGVALLVDGIALLFWHLGVNHVGMSPFFLFFAAVTIVSWLYGLGPGLLCAVLGILFANFAYAFPAHFVLVYPRGVLQAILYLFVAITVTWLNHQRRSLLASEQEIRRQFERLAAEQGAILSQMTEAVIVADPAGHIQYLNGAARRILGIDVESALPVSDLIASLGVLRPAGQAMPFDDMALIRAARGEQVVNAERRVRRLDGTSVDVLANARQVKDRDGTVLGVVATIRDVTVERELEREKEAIRSAVVHDLKNPLATIKGLSTLLSRRIARAALPEETRDTFLRQLEGIDAKSNQMVDLIDEFMEAAQRSSGAEPLDLAPVDLVTLVRRTVSCHDATSDRHFMHLEVPDGEMVGYWDAAQLERTVDNLVANAIKYSPQGGDITISLRRKDNHAVLTVQDHGIGIPSHDREHVFDRLYRAQNARSIAGTGMGLATVKQIVDRHQGEISLASSEGQGTTVEIRLPLPAGT